MLSHFDRVQACDRQTERQSDILPPHSPRIALRGKNELTVLLNVSKDFGFSIMGNFE